MADDFLESCKFQEHQLDIDAKILLETKQVTSHGRDNGEEPRGENCVRTRTDDNFYQSKEVTEVEKVIGHEVVTCLESENGPAFQSERVEKRSHSFNADVVAWSLGKEQHSGTTTGKIDHNKDVGRRHTSEEEMWNAFNRVDKNGLGYISRNDISHVLSLLGLPCTDEEVSDMVENANIDGHRRTIIYQEFVQMMVSKYYVSC